MLDRYSSALVIRIATVVTVFSFLSFSLLFNFKTLSRNVYAQEHKVDICHSTASHDNPYTQNNVDEDSVDSDTGNDNGNGDHYNQHQGPIWFPGITEEWGDIIPPVAGHSGRNWDANGQAIWNNRCNIPGLTTPTPSVTPSPTPVVGTPEPTPTVTDICANIDGIQTSVPSDLHLDASGKNCVAWELGGPGETGNGEGGSVLGTSTVSNPKGKVLGASTMANSGAGEDVFALVFSVGAFSLGLGVRKYSYASSFFKANNK